jgi:hypothetical protein
MPNPTRTGRGGVAGLVSSLLLVAAIPSLGACAVESPEAGPEPAAAPAPAALDVVRPVKLATRARVPEKEPGFVSAEVGEGTLVLEHGPELPAFAIGDVLGGTQGGGYLARVVAVRALDASRVELATVPADLTELIAEGHFRVHYDAREVEDEGGRGRKKVEAPLSLLDTSDVDVPARCALGADGTARLDAKVDLVPSVDLEIDVGARGDLDPTPELRELRFAVGGSLDVSARLHATGTLRGGCEIDLRELAGGAAVIPLPSLTFWAGPVPIVITNQVVPSAKAEVSVAFTAAEVKAEAHTRVGVEAGVEDRDGAWSTIWEPSGSAEGSASIEAPGAIEARATLRAGAELQARLYGVVGPSIGLEASARVTADSAAPYCRYDASVDGDVRAYALAEAGIDAGPLHLSLAKLDLVDLELAHFDGPRWSSALRRDAVCRDAR